MGLCELLQEGDFRKAQLQWQILVSEFDLIFQIKKLKQKVEAGGDWEDELDKQDLYFNIFKSLSFVIGNLLKPDGFTERNAAVIQT